MAFVSGELLLRSDPDDARCLPPALEKRLRDSLCMRIVRRRCSRSLRRAAVLRDAAAERWGATVASIASAKTKGEQLAEAGRGAARRAARAQSRREQRDEADADARLACLAIRYGSVVAAERRAAQCREKVAEAERGRSLDVLELRNRLAAFALHLDHETRGAARLRRLTPRDAQYARCRRAAAENARRGFFGAGGPFAGLDVVDVFKVENRCLLDEFQRGVEARRVPGEKKKAVKGLFCDVPARSIERLVLYGLRGDATRLERTLFDDAWLKDNVKTPGAPTQSSPGGFGGTAVSKPQDVQARRAARDAAHWRSSCYAILATDGAAAARPCFGAHERHQQLWHASSAFDAVPLGLVAAAQGDVPAAVCALTSAYEMDPAATARLLERAAAAIAPAG